MTTHAAHRGRPAHRWFARSTTRAVFASSVVTRWMRQENYVDAWWTRNNPLNNGQHWSYVNVPVITAPPSAWGR